MKSARIVHLTSVHGPFDIRIFHKECKSLAKAGYQVTFVVPHEKDEVVDGVQIKAVPRTRGRLSRMTKTVWRVYREAVRQKADVYYFHDPELIPVGLLLRAQGKKVVYDVHEDVPRDIVSKHYVPPRLRRPLAWLIERVENIACRRFSALIAVTPTIAERFRPLKGHTVVIHNFPRLDELAPPSQAVWRSRNCSVAYVGGMLVERGVREMVHAMALLPKGLHATLKLARDDFPEGLYEELSQHPGWQRVQDWGTVDRAGVARILSQVRAGLILFHPEPNNVQAMPHKLFEYMSAGIPVIASDFPLWHQIIQTADCGLLVDPLSPRAIAQAIEYILTHDEEAEAMGRRGREAVEKLYNWENEERKLVKLHANPASPAQAG